ncbi:aldehyde ferredoxin oxidoreductase family protein [Candidatus Bipolaricaulota bacterium]|nr:aldehyde ferredoxin oxidoreductase family protein [Candidatus Bipolaricaulota bacterium]
MHASFGKYLDVDLTEGHISDYAIPEDWQSRFVGGKGLAARLLLEELSASATALSPENILVFATGPFQGTMVVGGGRHAVLSISPKTGRVADSYSGGFFGHELARSGYDGLLIRGASEAPVILALIDGKASLERADDLWGAGTGATEESLKTRYPGARVSSIGVAGENRVVQACIINDRARAAGRPGFGAVMGFKKLKAIVVRGHLEKTLADSKRFTKERAAYAKTFTDSGYEHFGRYGTGGGVTVLSEMGILPTKNFQQGTFEHADAISGIRMEETILASRDTCVGCPIRCKRVVETTFAGEAVLPEFGGPEYETLAALGSLCLNKDLDSIALANQLCNDLGVDTISAGVVISFLMEASEKGLIETVIPWGDSPAIIKLVKDLAHREGWAGKAADGLDLLASRIGADFAMTIKGAELPMHEPRGKQGMGLSYATSPRGATHMEGMHDTMLASESPSPEIGVTHAYDRFTLSDKAQPTVAFENLRSFDNCLVICCFTPHATGEGYSYPAIRSLLAAATGQSMDAKHMLQVGERAYAAMRLLSGRAGHTISKDGLPARFSESLSTGASRNHPVDPSTMDKAIADYYDLRGYDKFGPTDETLKRLNMDDCVGKLQRGT